MEDEIGEYERTDSRISQLEEELRDLKEDTGLTAKRKHELIEELELSNYPPVAAPQGGRLTRSGSSGWLRPELANDNED